MRVRIVHTPRRSRMKSIKRRVKVKEVRPRSRIRAKLTSTKNVLTVVEMTKPIEMIFLG